MPAMGGRAHRREDTYEISDCRGLRHGRCVVFSLHQVRRTIMNRTHGLMVGLMVIGAVACAGERVPPKALVDARADYLRAKDGLAMQLDPTDVHEAEVALVRA